ncbi:MAG: addiction module antitoxin RelB [Methylovulum sp.]|nr:MAG: addiction module antitoxin RelB [Methylovulum sp.]
MSTIALNEIKNEALLLSTKDRAMLARELLESLDGEEEESIEEAWLLEAERRFALYQQGNVKIRAAAEVFSGIENQLK